jgi:hypothetical protein
MARKKKEVETISDTKKQLQIYEGEKALTLDETGKVCSLLTMEHLPLLRGSVSGKCQKIDGGYRGEGVCIAKKFLKYNPPIDYGCGTCKSREIIDQLNVIFKEAFEGQYRAEWRRKREYNKKKKDQ